MIETNVTTSIAIRIRQFSSLQYYRYETEYNYIRTRISLSLSNLVEDALLELLLQFYTGFNDTLRNQGISFRLWLVSNLLRFLEGVVSIGVIFVLVVSSSDVVSLFKDFTAMIFIFSLDNVFFSLASMGILGKR